MRSAGVFAVVMLALACFGQSPFGQAPVSQTRPVALTAQAATSGKVDFAGVAKLESAFEQRLKSLDPNDPVDQLGACSGVYLSGYGLVFTTPLSLVAAPVFGPFTGGFTPQKADAVHKRKLAQLPALRKAMSELLVQAAKASATLPPEEKVVVAVRLVYLNYEDKTGLPNQIVMSADRAAALSGAIHTDEQ